MEMDNPSLTAWLAAARAVHFAGCMAVGGVWAFDRLVVRDALPAWRRVAVRVSWIALPVILLSDVAWFVVLTASMSDSTVRDAMHLKMLHIVWSHTRFGHAWQVHSACFILFAMSLWFRRNAWVALVAAAGLIGSLAWCGHGSTGPMPAIHLTADVLHLLTSAVWPGGLLPMAIVLGSTSEATVIARIVRRFSAVSLIAVALLVVTGLFESWCLVGSWHALFATRYGLMLRIKLSLLVTMLGLGAMNLLLWSPLLSAGKISVAAKLKRSVWAELGLGSAVVIVVGLLGLLEPGRM